MNGKKHQLQSVLLGIIGFLFLMSASVTITLNFRPLYYLDMKLLQIPQESGYSAALIRENYDRLIDYNNWNGPDVLEFEGMAMSDTARIHFQEVKRVFCLFEAAAVATGILFLAGGFFESRKRQYGWLRSAALCSVGIPLILGMFILSDWQEVFIGFHRLVFRNDYWLFDPAADPIITVLPDTFFMHCAGMIVGLILVGAAVLYICWKRKSKNASEKLKCEL